MRAPNEAIGYTYTSRAEGNPFVSVRLTHIDGTPIISVPTPTLIGNELWWLGVLPGLDIFIRLALDKADLRKRILNAAAPRELRWQVRESDPLPLRRQQISIGQDNYDRLDGGRNGLGPGRTRRTIELQHTITPLSSVAGESRYIIDEVWTGRTFEVDPVTRVKTPSTDVVYPVEIDVLVEEEIAADGDDGFEGNSLWYNSYAATNNNLLDAGADTRIGFRFTSVAIPNAATIDDATFAVERAGTSSGGHTSDFAGSDEDNAAAFSDTNGPTDKTATTASLTAVNWGGTDGTDVSLDVQAIIAEITVRAEWSSGNSLALIQTTTLATGYLYLEDEADADVGAARLDVNYTAAGGSDVPVRHPYMQLYSQ